MDFSPLMISCMEAMLQKLFEWWWPKVPRSQGWGSVRSPQWQCPRVWNWVDSPAIYSRFQWETMMNQKIVGFSQHFRTQCWQLMQLRPPQAAVSFPASFGTDLPVGNQDLQSSEPRRMRSAGCLPGALRLASAVSMSNLLQRVVPEAQGLSTLRRCGCGKHGGSTGSSDVFFTCSFL